MNRICALFFSAIFTSCSFSQIVFPSGFVGFKLNNNGDVCGGYRSSPGAVNLPYIFHNDGSSTQLPLLPNTVKGNAIDINNSGSCIGVLEMSNGQQIGAFWDLNHNVTVSMSTFNEMPKALNDNNEIAYGEYVIGITEEGCIFGQTPFPDRRPYYWCSNTDYNILADAPQPPPIGMYIAGMDDESGTFGVNGSYVGAWRADIGMFF